MHLYLNYVHTHLKSRMQYKASFILACLSQIIIFFAYYFLIICLFEKFSNVRGFTLYEVLFTFGVIMFGTGFCEAVFRGVDEFDKIVINGGFDKILLRPRCVLFQVFCEEIDFTKFMKAIQALIALIIAIINLDITWTPLKVLTLLFMLFSSIIIFLSVFILAASYCFITIKGLEIRNILTNGCKEFAEYPIGIFRKGIVFILTFILPFGFVNYFPFLYILGRTNNILYVFSPLIVLIYLILSIIIFYRLLRRYTSTGS